MKPTTPTGGMVTMQLPVQVALDARASVGRMPDIFRLFDGHCRTFIKRAPSSSG
jgi:hypothetical protein